MSSILGIPYGTSPVNATKPTPYPPPTPIVEQQVGPYFSGKGYLQHPNSPNVGCPPSRLQFPPSSPPSMERYNMLLVYLKLVIILIIILLILGWMPVFGNFLFPSNLLHFGTDF